MLTPLVLTPVKVDRSKFLPPLLLELIDAAERGADLVPAVLAIVRKLDFDGFMYATATAIRLALTAPSPFPLYSATNCHGFAILIHGRPGTDLAQIVAKPHPRAGSQHGDFP